MSFFVNFEATALEVAGCILPFRQLFKFFLPGQLSFIMTMTIPLFSVFVFVIVLCLKKCKKLDNGQNRLRMGGSCEKAPRHFVQTRLWIRSFLSYSCFVFWVRRGRLLTVPITLFSRPFRINYTLFWNQRKIRLFPREVIHEIKGRNIFLDRLFFSSPKLKMLLNRNPPGVGASYEINVVHF